MKSLVVLFVFVIVAATSARPNHSESDLSTFDEEREVDYGIASNREHSRRGERRRHSRQISNRYDYQFLFYELHTIREQLNELEDIVKTLRTPPTVPAYGGYPQQLIFNINPIHASGDKSLSSNSNNLTDIDNRGNFGRPVWGNTNTNTNAVDEDDNDVGRPISFKPVNGNTPQGRPSPPVEHGSEQSGLSPTTTTTAAPKTLPGKCEAVIISCCRFDDFDRKQCFQKFGCIKTYNTGLACTSKVIQMVIKRFKDAYAPS